MRINENIWQIDDHECERYPIVLIAAWAYKYTSRILVCRHGVLR